MIEGTPLNQLAQQLIAERQMQRDFVADTRRLTPHPVGAAVSIELQHADGFTAVAPSRFALGQFASHYKIPMACVDRMTQAGAGSLLGQNLRTGLPSNRRRGCCEHALGKQESYAHFSHAGTVRWTTTSSPKP